MISKVSDAQAIAPLGVILLGGVYGSLAVARSLGRRGVPVCYFSTHRTVVSASRYVAHHVEWSGPDADNALQTLLDHSAARGLKNWLLLPSSDIDVQFVSRNHAILAKHFTLLTMPWSALEQLNDKTQLYALAGRLGIDCPEVYWNGTTRQSEADQISLPVVIKPASTERINPLTRAKAWKAETQPDYETRFAKATSFQGNGGFVVQQLIPGDGRVQFSYAGLWDRGREVCSMTARRARQFPAEFGTSPFVEAVELPRVTDAARALLEAIGYHGLVEVEFKLDSRDNQLKLLDVNTRIWAWIGLGGAADRDFPLLAFQLAFGHAPVVTKPPRYGAHWVHSAPNTLSLLQSLHRTRRLGFAGWAWLRPGGVHAVAATDDPLPGLAEIPILIGRGVSGLLRRALP